MVSINIDSGKHNFEHYKVSNRCGTAGLREGATQSVSQASLKLVFFFFF